jgi:hypothetical protein
VRSNVFVKMLVAIAYFVTLRVGVGAVIVTLLRIVWPEIEVTGSGVIVVVAFAVVVIINVWVDAVDVEVTLWIILASEFLYRKIVHSRNPISGIRVRDC